MSATVLAWLITRRAGRRLPGGHGFLPRAGAERIKPVARLSPPNLPPRGLGHISLRKPPEPILIPRLRIEFADFPDTTLF